MLQRQLERNRQRSASFQQRRLTHAETRVCELVLQGKTVADIARIRRVSTETVRTQIKSIYAKFHVRRRVELILTILSP